MPFPHFGGLLGKRGPGKIISPVAGSAGACTTRLFLLDHRTTCTVFLVIAMFAMTTMADSCTNPAKGRNSTSMLHVPLSLLTSTL